MNDDELIEQYLEDRAETGPCATDTFMAMSAAGIDIPENDLVSDFNPTEE